MDVGDDGYKLEVFVPPVGPGGVCLMAFSNAACWYVAWFALVEGTRQIVAEEVVPKDSNGMPPKAWAGTLETRLLMMEQQAASVPFPVLDRSQKRPSTAEIFEQLKVKLAVVAAADGMTVAHVKEGQAVGYTDEEQRLLPYLRDAVVYAQALATGDRAPAQAVAEDRTISPRTAQGRITKARALGLLAPAGRGKLSGELTPYAEDLLRRWSEADHAAFGELRSHE